MVFKAANAPPVHWHQYQYMTFLPSPFPSFLINTIFNFDPTSPQYMKIIESTNITLLINKNRLKAKRITTYPWLQPKITMVDDFSNNFQFPQAW